MTTKLPTKETIHTFSDDDIYSLGITCFGYFWDPKDAQCATSCFVYARCGYRLANQTLPQTALEAGITVADHIKGTLTPNLDKLDPGTVQDQYPEIQDYAIEYARSIYKNPNVGLPVIQPDGTLTPSGKWPYTMPHQVGSLYVPEGQEVLDQIQKSDITAQQTVEVGELTADGKKMLDVKTQVGQSSAVSELDVSAQTSIEQAIEDLAQTPPEAVDVVFGFDDREEKTEVTPKPQKKVTKKKITKKKAAKKTPVKKTVAKKATTKKKVAKKKVAKKARLEKKLTVKEIIADTPQPLKKTSTKKATTKKKTTKKKISTKKAPLKKALLNPPKPLKKKIIKKKVQKQATWGDMGKLQRRFNKDLQKPQLANLPWGHTITRMVDGKALSVTKTKEGWKYKNQHYPTLYSVMNAMKPAREYPAQLTTSGERPSGTRKMASMSAMRFFGFEKKS